MTQGYQAPAVRPQATPDSRKTREAGWHVSPNEGAFASLTQLGCLGKIFSNKYNLKNLHFL